MPDSSPYTIPPGGFLAAWPDLVDPNFFHRVLVVCQHGDAGAYGLVVNDPLEQTTRDLMPSHPIFGSLDFPVFRGGPVQTSTLQYLHRIPRELPGAAPVTDEVWIGGDFDALARFVHGHPLRNQRNRRVGGGINRGNEVILLKDKADIVQPEIDKVIVRQLVNIGAKHLDLPFGGPQDAAHDRNQRGFARSAFPHNIGHLAGADIGVDAVEHADGGLPGFEIADDPAR